VMVKGKRHGPGSRVMLQSGDSFDMGEFEVQVVFVEKKRPPPPAEKKSMIETLSADDLAQTVSPKDLPPPEPGLFDEPTYIGPAGSEEPTYIGPAAKIAPKPAPASKPAPAPAPVAPAAAKSAPAATAAAPQRSMKDALRLFLEGAGMPQKELTAEESERVLKECGAILRASVEGLMMLLIARSEMRKEFEAEERTMVAARDNNPLKLMGDAQEAMDFIFDPAQRNEGFLQPLQAMTDAATDLRAHELALMAGMRAAMMGTLRRFDPQVLEKTFQKSGGVGFSLGGRKAKMWELFVAHQQKLVQEGQDDFNKVFGQDFMAAYQSQLRRLKSGN
jgi:type VI secretion system FHA domain protein